MSDWEAKTDGQTNAEVWEVAQEELRAKTEGHDLLWNLSKCDWSADLDSGTLTFHNPDGKVISCEIQVVGTYNTLDKTFLWAWDHPSVNEELANHATAVKKFGEAKDEAKLTSRKVEATEDECWKFTALSAYLSDAAGAYRGVADDTWIFMTFNGPIISLPQAGEVGSEDALVLPELGEVRAIPDVVRQRVESFIAAAYRWELDAAAKNKNEEFETAHKAIEDSYAALLGKHCVPNAQTQGMSFGSSPSHDPATEKVVGGKKQAAKWIVRTSRTSKFGSETIHEYELLEIDGRWLIEQIYYVDEEGRWESL